MNLKAYFHKIRALEAEISEPHVVVISLETSDGGKPGRLTEVAKADAARLVVEGRARLATPDETASYRKAQLHALELEQQVANSAKYPVAIVSDTEIRALRGGRLSK